MKKLNSRQRYECRAISLVIVLGSLVFLSALVVAFLVQMGTELKSSKLYAEGSSARILAQSATNMVMAEIKDATKGYEGNETLAWASQPGAIHTFNTNGNVERVYKLYSDSQMTIIDGTWNSAAVAGDLANWDQNKAEYVDLNEPVSIDGVNSYPILDPSADGIVDGFDLNNAPVAAGGGNLAPMPVKWLYVLSDGAVVAPTNPGVAGANSVKVPGASAIRPIVGRIAFWTDDETSKVNINTAAEGTYSDTPRIHGTRTGSGYTGSPFEALLAYNQPVGSEYQRYPGHPAMNSLSTVLKPPTGWLPPTPNPFSTTVMSDAQWKDRQWAEEELYKFAPRIVPGGSVAGTRQTAGGVTVSALVPDADRLYENIDEAVFRPTLDNSGVREQNRSDAINSTTLERAKFFLTANSRAPDLNLFNKPRVAIWPISATSTPSHRTAFDRLIAFCSSLGKNSTTGDPYGFYFQRQFARSATADLPQSPNETGLGRNRMLLNYLRDLTDQNIPGFGGSLGEKYAAANGSATERDQILTEMFDYIRSTNLADSQLPAANRYTLQGAIGQVVPIQDVLRNTRGFGRFPTLMGCSILFIANADGDDPSSQVNAAGNPLAAAAQVPAGKRRIQAIFIPQFFNPAVGSVFYYPTFRWRVEGLNSLGWDNRSMVFPAAASNLRTMNFTAAATNGADNSSFGDQMGLKQFAHQDFVATAIDVDKSGNRFRFQGERLTFTIVAPDDNTELQRIVVEFPSGDFPLPELVTPALVQPLASNGSVISAPPTAGPVNFRYFIGGGANKGRLTSPSGFNSGAWFHDNDVVRSIGVKSGDPRIVMGYSVTPAPDTDKYPYQEVGLPNWGSGRVRGMHTFFTGNQEPYYGAKLGRLVRNVGYYDFGSGVYLSNGVTHRGVFAYSSAYPVPFNGVAVGEIRDFDAAQGDVPGDWDNAPLNLIDGPFINKPDEGDSNTSGGPYSWKGRDGITPLTSSRFTPNRMIPSAVNFGSLPTGVFANRPWQTLLFRPSPMGNHPGEKDFLGNGMPALENTPPDHLFLDLFHMPVVEPYAISEPASTAGRINMNYQIVPFTYIKRDTGIRSILKSEKVISIADSQAGAYKTHFNNTPDVRRDVNINETLIGFENRFATNRIFRSASEICELPIVPNNGTFASLSNSTPAANYWNTRRLTGDNSLERPYATIYPRLTTKSNTFMIHVRAQSLKKVRGTAGGQPDEWIEGRDQITGEYRGSQTVELFIDPDDPNIPDYADTAVNTPISNFYRMRVLDAKQFAP